MPGVATSAALRDRVRVQASLVSGSQTATMLNPPVGSSVRLTITCEDELGTRTDPTALRLLYRAPSDTSTTTLTYGGGEQVVREEEGRFHVDLVPDEPGEWRWRAEADGAVEGAAEGMFNVPPQAVEA